MNLRVIASNRTAVVAAALLVLVSACGSPKAIPGQTKASNVTVSSPSQQPPLTTRPNTVPPLASGVPAVSAADLLKQANQNAVARGWAHLAVKISGAGHTGTYSSDAGPSAGRQVVDIDQDHATVVFLGATAYIQGNAAAVSDYFGFPVSQVPRLTNQWVSLTPSDSGYAAVTDGVTLASALSEVSLDAPFTLAPTQVGGQQVIGISGQLSASDNSGTGPGTLYVTTGSQPLPVEFTATTSDAVQTVTFSAWGTPVALSAPSGAVPAASIPSS
jgi:hypothetical protein